MKLNILVLASSFCATAAAPLAAGQINFVYPPEGTAIPAVAKTFVFGNISPATATFTINGEKVSVHTNGGFLAYLPVSGGDFAFKGELSDGTTAQRGIKVRQAEAAAVPAGKMGLELTSNSADIEAAPGDYLKFSASGTPGRQAVLTLEGVFRDLPMAESPANSGRYSAYYRVKDSDSCSGAQLSARFKAGLFGRGASARSKGKVRISQVPSLVETATDTVVLRNAPEGGYMLFLGKGVKLVTDARSNGMRRVLLAAGETGWVEDSKVTHAGQASPAYNATETGTIRMKRTDFGSSATVVMGERVPYKAEVLPDRLRVTLYYTTLHTNWVIYDSSDTLVRNVSFRQTGANTAEIDFETGAGALWGYNIGYPNGSSRSLVVDLRARPKAALAWPRPLAGLDIVLDPGHSPKYTPPYDGAIGPMGTFEFQANMAIAKKAQEKLLALGATVQLTRNGDENLPLADRPKVAQALGGDIFISIHNNALGDGEDPFAAPRGFQVYYYQQHSMALAAALHGAYVRDIPLPDEGLRYGDYLVVRNTWMPAALIENAYMIVPRQEELLYTPEFQDRLASAITEGVLNFFGAPARPAAAQKKKGKK